MNAGKPAVRFIDTTYRDGAQSLWAGGMRSGMIEAVAEDMDRAGFEAIEVPVGGNRMKKSLRDLKEYPWDLARMVAARMPKTVKSCMAGGFIIPLYDYAQYLYQVPGGVISNLRHQLGEMRVLDRFDEMLEETVQVRKDFGYPIMITPHSQFVVAQAAINVMAGERYKHVIDEFILFAQGAYGEDSGYTWMDQNLKDRLLATPRAKELMELAARQEREITLKEVRESLGGPGVSDEEFLLRFLMKGMQEIEAMRAAGPPKQYFNTSMPLLTLIQELGKHRQVRYVQVQRGGDSLVVQNHTFA